MPTNIDHDVQRCRVFLDYMNAVIGRQTSLIVEQRAASAEGVVEPLAAVLAELERLREVEEETRKGDWSQ